MSLFVRIELATFNPYPVQELCSLKIVSPKGELLFAALSFFAIFFFHWTLRMLRVMCVEVLIARFEDYSPSRFFSTHQTYDRAKTCDRPLARAFFYVHDSWSSKLIKQVCNQLGAFPMFDSNERAHEI